MGGGHWSASLAGCLHPGRSTKGYPSNGESQNELQPACGRFQRDHEEGAALPGRRCWGLRSPIPSASPCLAVLTTALFSRAISAGPFAATPNVARTLRVFCPFHFLHNQNVRKP